MRAAPNLNVERYRIRDGRLGSSRFDGNNGAFDIPLGAGVRVFCIVSDGLEWDHVSVSLADRCPTWDEMCAVKELFFDAEETVLQYHPPRSEYRNHHPFCLHLWRPQTLVVPRPLPLMVAPPESRR